MSHYQAPICAGDDAEAAHALDRLRGVLLLVDQMAGREAPPEIAERALDDGAVLALGYANASSISRRRFDALAGETAAFAASGLAALIRHQQRSGRDAVPAARQLAEEMRRSIEAMATIIDPR